MFDVPEKHSKTIKVIILVAVADCMEGKGELGGPVCMDMQGQLLRTCKGNFLLV